MAVDSNLVLAGDIGGTHCRLGVFDVQALPGPPVFAVDYASRQFDGLQTVLRRFLDATPATGFGRWCIAVAGPTDGRTGQITNLDWMPLDAGLTSVLLVQAPGGFINDFGAVAEAIPHLAAEDQVPLFTPDDVSAGGTMVVTGPGSGLGVALIKPMEGFVIIESEGGHASFAPLTDQQRRLRNWLCRGNQRATNEMVLSGPGLYRLFRFIEDREPTVPPVRESVMAEIKQFLAENLGKDPAAIISRAGMSGEDEACRAALNLFCDILGAVAGDYALMAKATGGVYLEGGVIRGVLDYLAGSRLVEKFQDKSPQRQLLERIPLIAVRTDPGLLGAAMYAANRM